jgi:branched-chain amino acid transport system permease protein
MGTVVNVANGFLQLFAVYGTLNLGFIYLFRTTGVMNFAQGQIFMFAGLSLYFFASRTGLFYGLIITLVVLSVVGYLLYIVILRLLRGGSSLIQVLGTFMVGIGLTEICGVIYGPSIRQLTIPTGPIFHISGGDLETASLIEGAALIIIAILLDLLINKTIFGARMRAAAEDGTLSDYVGVKRHRLWAVSWGVVFLTSVLAAFVYAGRAPLSLTITSVGFSAFPAAIIGGMDSLSGMVVGAALAALIQSVAGYYADAVVADMLTYLVMLGVLLVKPTGLLGRRSVSRI